MVKCGMPSSARSPFIRKTFDTFDNSLRLGDTNDVSWNNGGLENEADPADWCTGASESGIPDVLT